MSKLKFIMFLLVGLAIISPLALMIEPGRQGIIEAYNFSRPFLLADGGKVCIKKLEESGVTFSKIGEFSDGPCGVLNPVKVRQFSSTKISAPVVLSCPTATLVDEWLIDIKAIKISHIGSYNCRAQRKSKLLSEHSFGTAIDITEIDEAKVSTDWGKANKKGEKLKAAYASACNYFVNVITPDDDALHQDHFHLDAGLGVGCWLKPQKKTVQKFLNALVSR